MKKENKNTPLEEAPRASMEAIEQIEVARSFSKTMQVKQYEPINAFASYKAVLKPGTTQKEVEAISSALYKMAVRAVERDILNTAEKHTAPF